MPESLYRFSRAADADLERLYNWGIDQFGLSAANTYYDALIVRFGEISGNPLYWQAVDHIRAGYRRSVCGVHSIYYRIEDDGVLIVRILGREDIETSLPKA
jgi:toxin ParE1/3/4